MTKKGSFLERLPLRGRGPAISSTVFAVILGVVSLVLIAVAVAAFLWNRPSPPNGTAKPRGEATETIVRPVPKPGGAETAPGPDAALKGVTAEPQGKMTGGGGAGGPAPAPGTPSVSPAAPKPAPPALAAPKPPAVEAKPPPPARAPAAAPTPAPAPRAEAAKPAPAPKAEAAKPQAPGFIVRAGTFKGKENAEKLKKRLAQRGLSMAEVKPVMNPKLGEMWVVELAPVSNRAQAEGLAAKVQSYEGVKPRIIEVER